MKSTIRQAPETHKQARGAVLLILLGILGLAAILFLVGRLSGVSTHNERNAITQAALVQAKDALIGDAVSPAAVASAGYLHLPDLGFGVGGVLTEGIAAANFAGNNQDQSLIGKIPWKTLGIAPLRDATQECLWYVVSGTMKNSPTTGTFNWDTQGQIDVIDGNGNSVALNIAALVVAPGSAKDGQNRASADPTYAQCGGNYDARNYLDAFYSADAISGEVNYFSGSINSRQASGTSNKRFVLADNDHYNDRFLFITVDDIFRLIIRRSDFASQIYNLLQDPDFISIAREVAISSDTRGTANLDNSCGCPTCSTIKTIANTDNKTFCKNWKEMLFLTELTGAPSPITIDGAATAPCSRVLIFAGQRSAFFNQSRITAAEKSNPDNYLEPPNKGAFATPISTGTNFAGQSAFNASNPSADIVRCLP